MDYSKAYQYVEKQLQGLSPQLTYHTAWHTLGDVLPVSIKLAKALQIEGKDLLLLKTAALFHDLGYLEQYDTNEPLAVKLAEQKLPEFGYNQEDIKQVCSIIMATSMPQKPLTIPEKIICDADLDSLSRNDFFSLSEKLRQEFSCYKKPVDKKEWLTIQLEFLKTHSYHTDVNIEFRNNGKLKNIAELESRISR